MIKSGIQPFAIGSRGQSSPQFRWIGGLDNLRFYNRKLSKREINSLYQVDTGQGIARSVTETPVDLSTGTVRLVTDRLTLNLEKQTVPYRLDLPENVDRNNLSLKVVKLVGFPPFNIVTPNATAKTGKDVVINLGNNPSRVRIRLKLTMANDEPYILVRSTFKLLAHSARDTPLTIDHLKNGIDATKTTLAKSIMDRAYCMGLLPDFLAEVRKYENFSSESDRTRYQIAQTSLTAVNTRVRSLMTDIPNLQRRRDRLQTLLGTFNEIHRIAVIHFEVKETPGGNSE